ncbi:MAG: ATP-dependent Clp protease adaptor ClpS [Fimbriimonadales bacterium]
MDVREHLGTPRRAKAEASFRTPKAASPQISIQASSPGIIEKPEIDELGPGSGGDGWIVTVYNNEHNTWQEVIVILMAATGCSFDEAYIETWEIDKLGKSVVHHGEETECHGAAAIIAQIGIRVEVSCE